MNNPQTIDADELGDEALDRTGADRWPILPGDVLLSRAAED